MFARESLPARKLHGATSMQNEASFQRHLNLMFSVGCLLYVTHDWHRTSANPSRPKPAR